MNVPENDLRYANNTKIALDKQRFMCYNKTVVNIYDYGYNLFEHKHTGVYQAVEAGATAVGHFR